MLPSSAKRRRLQKLEGSKAAPKPATKSPVNRAGPASRTGAAQPKAAAPAPEAADPIYRPIVCQNMIKDVLSLPAPARDAVASLGTLVGSLSGRDTEAALSSSEFLSKVQDRYIMLQNPVKAKRKGKKDRAEAKPAIPDSSLVNVTYEGMLNLHAAWRAYIANLARAPTPNGGAGAAPMLPSRLWQAELHGAMLRVVSCTALPWMAGRQGIVASARPRSLVLVLPQDRRVRVPLPGTVLQYLAGNQLVTLDYSRGMPSSGG